MKTAEQSGRGDRRGMALPIILIALFVFSIVMFAIAQQQQHETRFTAISLEQQRAFVLADAGLARALARHVARPYHSRWYGDPPGLKDDALPELNHAGRFDESSQLVDETGTAGAPTGGQKLEPNGTYTVLVEDRHSGELAGAEPSAASRLAFTDVYSKGTIDGPHGPVSALVFARLAIAPEPSFFGASAGVTPSFRVDESTPELVKRIIRYQVYFTDDVADLPYQTPNADTVKVQEKVREEVLLFHQNFLKNRDTFADLRDPTKVNATWHADTATTRPQWTPDQIKGLFTGMRGPAAVPPGTSAPDAPSGVFANLWTDHLLRRYRVSDLVPANTGIKYLIGSNPDAAKDNVVRNILGAFHPGTPFTPVPSVLKDPGVNTGDELLSLEGPQQTDVNQSRVAYNTNVACFVRMEASATILRGHWFPFPTPNTTQTAEDRAAVAKSVVDEPFFANRFRSSEVLTPAIVDEMRGENARANGLGASPPLVDSTYILSNPPGQEPYPIYLRYAGVNGQPPPSPPPPPPGFTAGSPFTQLSVPELVTFYGKYIETSAIFTGGSPHQRTPVPPVPTTPPPNRPPQSGNGGNGGGSTPGGGGGSRPGGMSIGGSGAGA